MQDPNRTQKIVYASQAMQASLPANFCGAPFTQMFLSPNGDAHVCCEGGGYLGNLKDSTLEQLWNGEKAQTLRREFLSGQPKQCQKNIDCKGCNRHYSDQLLHAEFKEVVSQPPQALDLILNGQCNVDCIMCEVKTKTTSLLDTPQFHTEIVEKVLPQVKLVSVKSGEPFVQKETYWLIHKMKEVNPDSRWRFTTNAQYRFNDKLKSELSGLQVERMIFSVDSIYKDTYEKIRYRSSFSTAMKTISDMEDWFVSERKDPNIEFHVNITLQKDNVLEVPETCLFFLEKGYRPHVIIVQEPAQFSLSQLGEEQWVEALQLYLKLDKRYDALIDDLYAPLVSLARENRSVRVRKLVAQLLFHWREVRDRENQICTLPFTQMSLFPDGSMKPCCWLPDYALTEKRDGDLLRTWNEQPMQELREQFISGPLTVCEEKVSHTKCNVQHGKSRYIYQHKRKNSKPPQRLHWYFSGKCNLECPSCYNWHFKDEFPESDVYWSQLTEQILPHLCEIEIVGGEPFYQKRTFQLIRKMKEINPLCTWLITTNGQFPFAGAIEEHLRTLRLSVISVSIDSLIPEKFARLRKKGVLDKSLKFLNDLVQYRNQQEMGFGFRINVNFVFQKENWLEVPEFLKLAREKSVKIFFLPLIDPPTLSVFSWSVEEKRKILSFLQPFAQEAKDISNLNEVIQSLQENLLKQGPRARIQLPEFANL